MIRYTLKCDNDHGFDSWFQNAAAFESLAAAGHLACPDCGSSAVHKSLMTPRVTTARRKADAPNQTPEPMQATSQQAPTAPTAQNPASPPEPAQGPEADIAKIKKHIEANSDYVGLEFATQARAMHDGSAPERSIFGEAKPEEALKLLDEGIPVMPLPFIPTRKTN
ncbi:MAG: DUF1178 family protein [Maritimibacter sp.]